MSRPSYKSRVRSQLGPKRSGLNCESMLDLQLGQKGVAQLRVEGRLAKSDKNSLTLVASQEWTGPSIVCRGGVRTRKMKWLASLLRVDSGHLKWGKNEAGACFVPWVDLQKWDKKKRPPM